MNIIFLTQVTGILKPFAWIMGIILDAIYKFFNLFGVQNIALCIFVFTFVMKMLMLPLTIKQQKYSRVSSKMSPEISKIQEKYKGKKDEDSLRRQQAETQEVYAKYGTSPIGGCLPLLITLPIMFALYRVIYAVPAYVSDVGALYGTVADGIMGINGHAEALQAFIADNALKNITTTFTDFAAGTEAYRNGIIDVLAKFGTNEWNIFFENSVFATLQTSMAPVVESIKSVNNLFSLSILDTPRWNEISVIIPILAVVTQFIQGKLQGTGTDKNTKADENNPMAGSAKTMMTVMPIMSGVFCLMLPIGVGVYWIATALFTIIQTIFINKYLDKADLDEMIEKNVQKAQKKKAKLGVEYGNKMAEVAKTSTKVYDTSYDSTSYKKNSSRKSVSGADYKRSNVSYKASSIAANANLLAARDTTEKVTEPVAESSAPTSEEQN